MAQEKIKKIKDLLQKLYCFEQAEIDKFMVRIPYMQEEGMSKLIKTLKEGLKEQDELLKKWTERDPKYADKLAAFAVETSDRITGKYEKKEKSSAEDILKELE